MNHLPFFITISHVQHTHTHTGTRMDKIVARCDVVFAVEKASMH